MENDYPILTDLGAFVDRMNSSMTNTENYTDVVHAVEAEKLVSKLQEEINRVSDELMELRFTKDPEIVDGVKDLAIAHLKQVQMRIRADRDLVREERDGMQAKIVELREALRKGIVWGEAISMRLSGYEREKINWTYLEEARKALKGEF